MFSWFSGWFGSVVVVVFGTGFVTVAVAVAVAVADVDVASILFCSLLIFFLVSKARDFDNFDFNMEDARSIPRLCLTICANFFSCV